MVSKSNRTYRCSSCSKLNKCLDLTEIKSKSGAASISHIGLLDLRPAVQTLTDERQAGAVSLAATLEGK
jgi:hypothetical protein